MAGNYQMPLGAIGLGVHGLGGETTSGRVNYAGRQTGSSPSVAGGTFNKIQLSAKEDEKLRKAAADFEAVFLKQLMGAMRKTVPDWGEGGLLKKGQGEKIFRDMLDQEYATIGSQTQGGLGLKEAIYEQLLRRPGRPAGANQSIQDIMAKQAALNGATRRGE
uniref:Putative flagellar protein FlgJ n=1 Tax=Magnetococcus massalia (strain MO-1) TaxID=451514 RepID=A0A1S7LC00_MAGMO|nr:Putative flagellar protein FlgJ [Candidatus Magnetococcus massalia]